MDGQLNRTESWLLGTIAGAASSHSASVVLAALLACAGCAERAKVAELERLDHESEFHRAARRLNDRLAWTGFRLITAKGYSSLTSARDSPYGKWSSLGTTLDVLRDPGTYDATYQCMADQDSRDVFDWFLGMRTAYAVLGEGAFDLFRPPISKEEYWAIVKRHRSRLRSSRTEVDGLVVEADAQSIVDTWVLEQYRVGDHVDVSRGDAVIDVGAYEGDTALWFAKRVGSAGYVVAVEPSARSRGVLEKNLRGNHWSSWARVRVEACALGRTQGCVSMSDDGLSSAYVSAADGSVPLTTVDELVEHDQGLSSRRLFIKADVEGGECDVLEGAAGTIAGYHPLLALACYHKPDDLPRLVQTVRLLSKDSYQFFLSHKGPFWSETVLFCRPRLVDIEAHASLSPRGY